MEKPKLLKLVLFNYLFSNGDAHFKNFSLLETPLGDYRLSPAYDLLNSRIHVEDHDFALEDGLLPKPLAQGKVMPQFSMLAEQAGIPKKILAGIADLLLSKTAEVEKLTFNSYLDPKTQRHYRESYQWRLGQLKKNEVLCRYPVTIVRSGPSLFPRSGFRFDPFKFHH